MTPPLRGLRVVAIFEAAKGAVVLPAGFGALLALDHGAAPFADALVRHMHSNPAKEAPRVSLESLNDVSNRELQALALVPTRSDGACRRARCRACELARTPRARLWK